MHWLDRLLKRDNHKVPLDSRITLTELSERTGIKKITLWAAIQDGRLNAVQSGTIWLSTVEDVEDAIENGRMKRP